MLTKASCRNVTESTGLRLKDLGLVVALTLTCSVTVDVFPLFLHLHLLYLKMKELDHLQDLSSSSKHLHVRHLMYTWRGRRFEDTSLSTSGKSAKTGNRLKWPTLSSSCKDKVQIRSGRGESGCGQGGSTLLLWQAASLPPEISCSHRKPMKRQGRRVRSLGTPPFLSFVDLI